MKYEQENIRFNKISLTLNQFSIIMCLYIFKTLLANDIVISDESLKLVCIQNDSFK